jgi:hypothetical protein
VDVTLSKSVELFIVLWNCVCLPSTWFLTFQCRLPRVGNLMITIIMVQGLSGIFRCLLVPSWRFVFFIKPFKATLWVLNLADAILIFSFKLGYLTMQGFFQSRCARENGICHHLYLISKCVLKSSWRRRRLSSRIRTPVLQTCTVFSLVELTWDMRWSPFRVLLGWVDFVQPSEAWRV